MDRYPGIEGRGQHSLCPAGFSCEPFKFSPSSDVLNKSVLQPQGGLKIPERLNGSVTWLLFLCRANMSSDPRERQNVPFYLPLLSLFPLHPQPILRLSIHPFFQGLTPSLRGSLSQMP